MLTTKKKFGNKHLENEALNETKAINIKFSNKKHRETTVEINKFLGSSWQVTDSYALSNKISNGDNENMFLKTHYQSCCALLSKNRPSNQRE